jgi:hypothetical protein
VKPLVQPRAGPQQLFDGKRRRDPLDAHGRKSYAAELETAGLASPYEDSGAFAIGLEKGSGEWSIRKIAV